MRTWWSVALLAAAVCAAAGAWGAPASTPVQDVKEYKKLPAGRYSVKVIGMLTTTCARGIELEVRKLPEVESAEADFDSETLTVTVKLNKTLKASTLRKALHRAADRVNLGADYFAGPIGFLP